MKSGPAPGLRREIGLGAAITVVVANMIGTGVFTTSGFILAELGSTQALLLCWLLGAVFAMTGALCYGELGAMYPEAGGEYAYLRHSFGPLPAFVAGWISLVVGFSAPIAATAIAVATTLLGSQGTQWWCLEAAGRCWVRISSVTVLAIGVVVTLSLTHCQSLRVGRCTQNLLTSLKVGFIIALFVAAFGFGDGDATRIKASLLGDGLQASLTGNFAVALIFVSFAYSGWNAAAYLGAEIQCPARNLPLALTTGTIFVSVLYLLLNLVYIYALPVSAMSGMLDVASGAASALFGEGAAHVVSLCIALGLLSVLSAMVMTGPRVYYAMAQHGVFYCSLARVSAVRHTPIRAIGFQAAIAIGMIVTSAFDTLLIYVGFTLSLSAMLTVCGLLRLRRREPLRPRPYRVWGYPFTPAIFLLGNLWVAVYSIINRPAISFYGIATLALGVALYSLFRHRQAALGIDQNEKSASAAPVPDST